MSVSAGPPVVETQAKTLLFRTKDPGSWFGSDFGMNLYRGCHHQCIYCDSRSECYGIDDFGTVQVKINALDLLGKELVRKRAGLVIGSGSMSDPYVPPERAYNLTGRALELIQSRGLGVHICTKSDLVTRDLPVLAEIARVRASVAFTVTTADDELAAKVEPFAPLPSRRYAAMARLAEAGVVTGTLMTPVLPFIEDTVANVVEVVERTAACGGRFVLSWFGMTLRDRQRDYYYARLDERFPGLRAAYERRYGGRYSCEAPGAASLATAVREACSRHGLISDMEEFGAAFPVRRPEQLKLF